MIIGGFLVGNTFFGGLCQDRQGVLPPPGAPPHHPFFFLFFCGVHGFLCICIFVVSCLVLASSVRDLRGGMGWRRGILIFDFGTAFGTALGRGEGGLLAEEI